MQTIKFENKKLNEKLAKMNDVVFMDKRTKWRIKMGFELDCNNMIMLYNKIEIVYKDLGLRFNTKNDRIAFFTKLNNVIKDILDKAIQRAKSNKRLLVKECDL
jgi:hypothetical protein